MSSLQKYTCDGCGAVELGQQLPKTWATMTIAIPRAFVDDTGQPMLAENVRVDGIDICATCRPALVAILPHLDKQAEALVSGARQTK